MLEAVQIEAWAAMGGVAMNAVAIYLTVVSGYLLVAYTVGRKLTKIQLIIISTLFVVFAFFFTMGAKIHFVKAEEYAASIGVYNGTDVSITIFYAQVAGIIAALGFMYSSRKNPNSNFQRFDT